MKPAYTYAILSLLWLLVVAFVCWSSWPQLPLDISANDPATLEAYGVATLKHTALHTMIGLAGPLLLLVPFRKKLSR